MSRVKLGHVSSPSILPLLDDELNNSSEPGGVTDMVPKKA
jgi:hypothetical protein